MKNLTHELFMTVPFVSFIRTDSEARILDVNKAFTKITGYRLAEVKGKKIGKATGILFSGEHPDEFYAEMWETLQSNKLWVCDLVKNRDKFGNTIYEKKVVHAVVDAANNITGYVGVGIDITDEYRRQKELAFTVEASGTLFFIFDPTGTYLECFPSVSEHYLIQPEDAVGKTVREVWYKHNPRMVEDFERAVVRAKETRAPQQFDYEIQFPNTGNSKQALTRQYRAVVTAVNGSRFVASVQHISESLELRLLKRVDQVLEKLQQRQL